MVDVRVERAGCWPVQLAEMDTHRPAFSQASLHLHRDTPERPDRGLPRAGRGEFAVLIHVSVSALSPRWFCQRCSASSCCFTALFHALGLPCAISVHIDMQCRP